MPLTFTCLELYSPNANMYEGHLIAIWGSGLHIEYWTIYRRKKGTNTQTDGQTSYSIIILDNKIMIRFLLTLLFMKYL